MLRHYRPYREGLDSCEGNILLSSCIFVHVLLYVHFELGWLKIDLITLWCVGCAHAGTTACTTHLWLPISVSSCLFMTHWATQPTASHGTSINRSVLVQVGLHFISCVPSSSPCISPGTQLIMLLTLQLAQLLHAYSFNAKWLLHVYRLWLYIIVLLYVFDNTYIHILWVYICRRKREEGPGLCVLSTRCGRNSGPTRSVCAAILQLAALQNKAVFVSSVAPYIRGDASHVGQIQDLLDQFLQSWRQIAPDLGCSTIWLSGSVTHTAKRTFLRK